MGTCRKCGRSTKYNYPLCWQHYYFYIESGRFWAAFVITLIWEYLINFPIITEEGLMIMLMNSLFDATHFIRFLVGAIVAEVLVFIPSLMFFNYLVYKYFFSKKAIIKL